MTIIAPASSRPRVVILGAGFAGLYAARALGRAPVDIVVVDRVNHHLFQPLLYQVAAAVLAPSDVTVPIRWCLRKQRNTTVALAEVTEIDIHRRVVRLSEAPHELTYDYLIVATGSRHSYFGRPEWERVAVGLKSLEDALAIRQRFLLAFERAEWARDEAEREANTTFVVVGGGATGVELAGIMAPASRRAFRKDFRRFDTARARVILLEGGDRLLPAFPAPLSNRVKADLEALGVEVRLHTKVTSVEAGAVCVGDERIVSNAIFWAAGNVASPLGSMLDARTDAAGRVQVAPDLSLPGHPECFVAGDLCHFTHADRSIPAVAPAAMQQGVLAAENIKRDLRGQARVPFRYRDKGDLATVGRHRAIASFGQGRLQLSGVLAWWLWLVVHILYLAGFRNRASVLIQWAFGYFTYQRGARLITGWPPES